MKREFYIDYCLDDAGVATYCATREEDYDNDGFLNPDSFIGRGESELYALLNLLEKFASANEEIDYDYHGAK
jgi:hypothetical protein